jgi:hypothetical protein
MRDLHKNHKKIISTILLSAFVVLGGLSAVMLYAVKDTDNQRRADNAQMESKKTAVVQPATTVRFTAVAGKTILEQLEQTAGDVTIKDSSYGQYVEAINGVKGGTDNKYWTYYVNGQMANIGAGEYETKGGEEIVWKFE